MDKIKAAVLIELDEHQKEELEAAGKDMVEFVYVPEDMSREERLPLLKQAQIIFGQPGIREINQCEHLRWIQMSWAGTDVYTAREGFPRQVALTNASGCFHIVIPEYVIAVLLELCRNLKAYAVQQQEKKWSPIPSEMLLYGKRALILGAGDIGTGVAERLCAFGVKTIGMRKTDRNYPDCYDGMITPDELDQELPKADMVIGCLPGTAKTKSLLNLRRLCLMKPGALLVNVGRGNLIDTGDLIEVLEQGHLGGVALDVTDPEPLPEDHPLWNMDRVIITPHIAGQSFGYSKDTEERIVHLWCQNLKRYLEGKELVNRVSFETGYASK